MPFTFPDTLLEPKEVGYLSRMLERMAASEDECSDGERAELASVLVTLFRLGVKDEAALFNLSADSWARQKAA